MSSKGPSIESLRAKQCKHGNMHYDLFNFVNSRMQLRIMHAVTM